MSKTVIVTFTRVYKRVVEREVSEELVKDMTDEQIHTFLIEEWVEVDDNDNGLFEDVELELIQHEESEHADTDRFDIYQDDVNVYGGHL